MFAKFATSTAPKHLKRSHKKSRTGCATCRQRRVKCDETKPACNACTARSLTCQYQGRASDAKSPSSTSTKSDSSSSADHALDDNPSPEIPEKTLAYHYLSHTCETLAATSSEACQNHRWRVIVPSQAINSRPVRSGMLAVSACCMYFHSIPSCTEEAMRMLRTAVFYYDSCLTDVKEMVGHLQDAKCLDSVITSTRLLFILGLAFCRVERSMGSSLSSPEYWTWLPLLRGIPAVYRSMKAADLQKALRWQVDMTHETAPRPFEPFESSEMNEVVPASPHVDVLAEAWSGTAERLRSILHAREAYTSVDEIFEYRDAIDNLDGIVSHICNAAQVHSLIRATFIWPSEISQGFAALLMSGDSLALTIYAQWLLLLVPLEHHWMVGDMGRSGIVDIAERSLCWDLDEQLVVLETVRTLELLS